MCILSVNWVWGTILTEKECCFRARDSSNIRMMSCNNDLQGTSVSTIDICKRENILYRQSECIPKSHNRYEKRTNLPRKSYRLAFCSFWPKKVEEKSGTENGSYNDTNEDVVGGDTNNIIVLSYCTSSTSSRYAVLLVNVIWWRGRSMFLSQSYKAA
jgi:hypothetical protein